MATRATGGLDIASLVDQTLLLSQTAVSRRRGPSREVDPFRRMFNSKLGHAAVGIVGNETRTVSILSNLAAETLLNAPVYSQADATGPLGIASADAVPLIVPSKAETNPLGGRPPAILLLDPHLPPGFRPEHIPHDEIMRRPDFTNISALASSINKSAEALPPETRRGAQTRAVAGAAMQLGPEGIRELLSVAAPEVILARHPEMELVGSPSPALEIVCTPPGKPVNSSSVGIFCRDADGELGVTACLHGTGPVGTAVTVGGVPSEVKHADAVQDLVFIPIPEGYPIPNFFYGLKGVRTAKAPGESDPAAFEGKTSGRIETAVSSYNKGLLILDPYTQSRLQTPAVVNHGDSGSALIDENDQVMGFAFRRTKYGQPIEFADWIWAANAMAALGLQSM